MSVSSNPATGSVATPVVIPLSRSLVWLVGTAALAVLVYYFVGVDQGAVSVFGNDLHVHELLHDGRHFLGFPCH
ncbi:CbtB domain-containing protein [Dactylosporangium sp. CA-233914]|uniref:CbtB domain-containing protein n=1 Tax=Dactylosporangium sp. CA-233914 TaxID=3239934 RepID=UPI003D8C4E72